MKKILHIVALSLCALSFSGATLSDNTHFKPINSSYFPPPEVSKVPGPPPPAPPPCEGGVYNDVEKIWDCPPPG